MKRYFWIGFILAAIFFIPHVASASHTISTNAQIYNGSVCGGVMNYNASYNTNYLASITQRNYIYANGYLVLSNSSTLTGYGGYMSGSVSGNNNNSMFWEIRSYFTGTVNYYGWSYNSSKSAYAYGNCSTPHEPNDTTVQAYPISSGQQINSYIASGGTDLDYYKINPGTATNLKLYLTVPSDANYDMGLYNSLGTLIASSTLEMGQSEYLNIPVTNQTYYIKISSALTQVSTSAYTLRAMLDTNEPNDSTGTASQINADTNYTSYISDPTDTDYYSFTPNTSGEFVSFLTVPAGKNFDLKLYDSTGNQIAASELGIGIQERIVFNSIANTTYYLQVNGSSGDYDGNAYSLITRTNTFEPNENMSAAYTVLSSTSSGSSNTYNSFIFSNTDQDYYKFTAGTTGKIRLQLYVPTGKNYDLKIYDSGGNQTAISASTSTSGNTEQVDLYITANSTYYIHVYGYNGDYGSDLYTLYVGYNEPDTYELNDSTATAYTVSPGTIYSSYISLSSDKDYFKFTSPTSGAIGISLSVPSNKNYNIQVLNSSGVIVTGSYAGTGGTDVVGFGVAANQTYYIYVYYYSGSSGSNEYTLSLGSIQNDTFEPNDSTSTAYLVSPGTSYSSYIPVSKDYDYYKFTTVNTGKMEVSLSVPSDKNYNIQLLNSSGSVITSSSNSTGIAEKMTFAVTANSSYYVKIFGYSTSDYSSTEYTLTLSPNNIDSYELNDTSSTSYNVSMGSSYTSYISLNGDQDYYKLTPATSGYLDINLSVPTDKNYDLEVYNTSGGLLYQSNNGIGVNENLSFSVTANTLYYIKVTGSGGSYGSIPYNLAITVIDLYEPNDSNTAAYSVNYNTLYSAYVRNSSDADFYKIVPATTGNSHITVKVPANKNYDVTIYDANMNIIALGTQGTGVKEEVPFRVTSGSTYYIKISGVNNDFSSMAYSFKISQVLVNYQYSTGSRLTSWSFQKGIYIYKGTFIYDSNGNLINLVHSITETN